MKIYGLPFSIRAFSIYYIDPTPPDLTHEISDLAYLALIFKTDSDYHKIIILVKIPDDEKHDSNYLSYCLSHMKLNLKILKSS